MSGVIRNFCVARARLTTNGSHVLYTVPAGSSFIMKALGVVMWGNTGGQVVLGLGDRAATLSLRLVNQNLANSAFYTWSGEVVLNDGDQVNEYNADNPLDFWISGALLPYAAGQQAPV